MRKVYLETEYGFVKLPYGIKSLKPGDRFKIVNPVSGKTVTKKNGDEILKCVREPYIDDETGEWMVQIL